MFAVVCGSALCASGGILSGPADFPDFSFFIALTSSLDGLSQFNSSSISASGIDGVSVGDGLLSILPKCSTYLCNCSSSLVKMFSSLSLTWLLQVYFPANFFVVS